MMRTDVISSPFDLIPTEMSFKIFGYLTKESDILSSRAVCKGWNEDVIGGLADRWHKLEQCDPKGPIDLTNRMQNIKSLQQDQKSTHAIFFKVLALDVERTYPSIQIRSSFLNVDYVEVQKMARHCNELDRNLTSMWRKMPIVGDYPFGTGQQIRRSMNDLKNGLFFQRITELNLSNSELTMLPPEMEFFTELKILELQNNQLTVLPGLVGCFTSLEWLNLTGNQLRFLPEEMGKLKSLDTLILSNNQLENLPESMEELNVLRVLSLDNNRLREVSTIRACLGSLEYLSFNGNPLDDDEEAEIGNVLRSLEGEESEEEEGCTRDLLDSDSEDEDRFLDIQDMTRKLERTHKPE